MKSLLLALLLFALTAHATTTTRYFLVSYSYPAGTGTIGMSGTTFPTKASIAAKVRTTITDTTMRISIVSILEFKTKTDYDNFFAGSPVSEYITQVQPKPVHDTLRISYPIHDTLRISYPVHDTTRISFPVHDTTRISYPVHDTIRIHDTIQPTARTWYLRDLNILPNTGQCLTSRVQQVMDSAVALGGQTSIVISDEGTYNLTPPPDVTTARAAVTLTYSCYPGEDKVAAIVVDKCK